MRGVTQQGYLRPPQMGYPCTLVFRDGFEDAIDHNPFRLLNPVWM